MTPIGIVRVLRRARKGITRPFLCESDDGQLYWCKGHDAGKRALCAEWLAGRMAQDLGLPIAPFVQAHVPSELVEHSAMEDIRDLGAGIVFASAHVSGADELMLPCVKRVPRELRWKILVYDWWIQNEDRTLYERGGNVNVLWHPVRDEIVIIDHNIAFDEGFDPQQFRSEHVFRDELDWQPSADAIDFLDKMTYIYTRFSDYWSEIPSDWTRAATLSEYGTPERIMNVLARFSDIKSLFRDDVR